MDFSKTSMCAFLAATSFRRRMSASFVHFLCATTGAPRADDETVTMSHRFGTTTVTDSESLEVVVSASDKLRRSVKADSAYRAGRQGNERDDEVPHREAGWRAGRRGSDSNRGGEGARRGASAASVLAELAFDCWKSRETTEKLPKLSKCRDQDLRD
jgi:hypothetical protein